ncbi:MAG: YlxR family protein [Lachnospiraceae bacterium]|nr:YlxR family protein [Lachnospiraceae bacterium]
MKMSKKIPMRLCIGCGESRPKKEMMRVVRTQEDTFVLDMTGKKNGRGAYLCKNGQCLKSAVKNKGLERSFKMSIPKEVYESLTEEFDKIETE